MGLTVPRYVFIVVIINVAFLSLKKRMRENDKPKRRNEPRRGNKRRKLQQKKQNLKPRSLER